MNIGLNVIETNGSATTPLVAASTDVAGFLVTAERGPVEKPIKVNSWVEYQEIFGGFSDDTSVSAYAMKGFFDNGGSQAWVVRLTTADHKVAEIEVTSGSFTIKAAYKGEEAPGHWANKYNVIIKEITEEDKKFYTLFVRKDTGKKDAGGNKTYKNVEVVRNKSAADLILEVNQNSEYIKFDVESPDLIKEVSSADFAGGSIKTAENIFTSLTDADIKKHFAYFNSVSIQILVCPDATQQSNNIAKRVTQAAIIYSKEDFRNDCIYIESVPSALKASDVAAIETYVASGLRSFERSASYAAMYAAWLQVSDAKRPEIKKDIPACGHIAGIYARISSQRGVWKAPAGDEAAILGISGITKQYSDSEHNDLVVNSGVNCIRFVPGSGIVVDSSRTLCSHTLWQYVNVRRLFNFVKSTLKTGLRWVRQEPNTQELWNKIKFNIVTPFLLELWKQGAFGTGNPEEVFSVKCDQDNNPPHKVKQGLLKVQITFYPSRPAETIVIEVGQQDFGGSVSES